MVAFQTGDLPIQDTCELMFVPNIFILIMYDTDQSLLCFSGLGGGLFWSGRTCSWAYWDAALPFLHRTRFIAF